MQTDGAAGTAFVVAKDTGTDDVESLREALRRVAVALKEADLPFALAGGYAAYAHGGPEPAHDVDFVIRSDVVQDSARVLESAGLRVEFPAEDWLFKAWYDETPEPAMVDIVHRVAGVPVDAAMIERADVIQVVSVRMPVLAATDVLATKLRAMSEHYCDYSRVLPSARALREQVDWQRLREETGDNDFAAAFLFLLERLGVIAA